MNLIGVRSLLAYYFTEDQLDGSPASERNRSNCGGRRSGAGPTGLRLPVDPQGAGIHTMMDETTPGLVVRINPRTNGVR
jgi:hypothetical protein